MQETPAAVLSLMLRTYYDGTRHGFTDTWQENMEEVAAQARAVLKDVDTDPKTARMWAAAPDLLEVAVGALLWLDNLERRVGKDTLLDALPNNFNGRIGLREAIRKATEASDPREE